MKCEICNSLFENIRSLTNHIRQKYNITLKEYYDKYLKKDKEGICLKCGKETKFNGFGKGYYLHCSLKCARSNVNRKEKLCIKKYGVKNVFQLKNVKKKIEEIKIKKYGNKNYNNSLKAQNTCLNKYGSCNNYNKIKNTFIEKYNVENISQLKNINNKIKNTKEKKYIKKIKNIENIEFVKYENGKLQLRCKLCNNLFEMTKQMINLRFKNKLVICNICNPYCKKNSQYELDIFNFIKENYNNQIIINDRDILNGKELDIYLPAKKLAFEFNGLYWHNELYVEKKYHLNKTELCEEKGIHLIHIYEDDWVYKQDIVKSRILNLLGKSNKIYARQCNVKNVSYIESKEFLINNHIQGNCISKYRLGLYYKNELVSLMTFGKLRKNLGNKNINNQYELLRFCNKLNISVIGGANKLFKYFIKNYNPLQIISYADRSWTMNNNNTLYDKLGFKFIGNTDVNYYYINNNIRENRFKYRKDVLIKEGYDKNKTESEIMFNRKIYKIYDSGSLKYIWD